MQLLDESGDIHVAASLLVAETPMYVGAHVHGQTVIAKYDRVYIILFASGLCSIGMAEGPHDEFEDRYMMGPEKFPDDEPEVAYA